MRSEADFRIPALAGRRNNAANVHNDGSGTVKPLYTEMRGP